MKNNEKDSETKERKRKVSIEASKKFFYESNNVKLQHKKSQQTLDISLPPKISIEEEKSDKVDILTKEEELLMTKKRKINEYLEKKKKKQLMKGQREKLERKRIEQETVSNFK
eukprot:gene7230-11545_t